MTDENSQTQSQDENESPPEANPETAVIDAEALKAELKECQDKANEYLDGWQRARADFANYKKRVERDQSVAYQNATISVIRRFLEVLDDLELALKNKPNDGDGAKWAEGVELIGRKLNSILDAEGVSPILAEGQTFDPNQHEAITYEQYPGLESGQVIAVVKQGYCLGDRILRPAQVRVAS
jgi:molecular chaperone GrpE